MFLNTLSKTIVDFKDYFKKKSKSEVYLEVITRLDGVLIALSVEHL